MEFLQSLTTTLSNGINWISGVSSGSSYVLTRWVFLRLLGTVYLIAFLSYWVQIKGLIGSNGILPAQSFLHALRPVLGEGRFFDLPTVFWIIGASDAALHLVCALGVLASLLLLLGVAPMISCIVLFTLYLSVYTVGQDFLSFQWDILLLETGFLAIFLAPYNLVPGISNEAPVNVLALLLLWWLLFRFMFESGVVKLTAGDSNWWNLTALSYHYETQPLATWTAWYMHNMPLWFHKLSTLVTFAIELVVPFLIVFGRVPRIVASVAITALMIVIGATGNYNFFNLLTIALALLLLDDGVLQAILPERVLSFIGTPTVAGSLPQSLLIGTSIVAVIVLLVGAGQVARSFRKTDRVPAFVRQLERAVSPFQIVNGYGLFRVMTTRRPEIIVEGSASPIQQARLPDGQAQGLRQASQNAEWKEYEFKWKPGNPAAVPKFIEPHQPRLDWQMWFAALSNFQRTQWFQQFLGKLLQGSPDVLALLKTNPFPDQPPKYIRALLYDYHFTTREERKASGHYWKRTLLGNYSPVLSLE